MKRSFSFLLAILGLTCGCTHPSSKLPIYDHVPDFAMTDAAGKPFSAGQMNGSVWVVDFIYTNCPAECPRMSSQMHKVEGQFAGEPDVHFLSISVDPERDTPPVLAAFAHRWGAPNRQWQFVTGSPQTVHLLANSTFHVGDVIDLIEHSTKFAVVDKKRTIRGYYSSFDGESLAQMRQDIEALRKARL